MKAKNIHEEYDDAEHQDTFNPFFMSTNNATAASIAQKMHHFEGIDLTHARRLIEVWNLKRVRGPRARPDAGYGLLGLGAHALPAQHPAHTHSSNRRVNGEAARGEVANSNFTELTLPSGDRASPLVSATALPVRQPGRQQP